MWTASKERVGFSTALPFLASSLLRFDSSSDSRREVGKKASPALTVNDSSRLIEYSLLIEKTCRESRKRGRETVVSTREEGKKKTETNRASDDGDDHLPSTPSLFLLALALNLSDLPAT
jgi:hypothetical protein